MTSHQGFETAADALTFIFAGRAKFTISSAKTGKHFTFKCTQKVNDDGSVTPFFVSVLNGPDNWENFKFIGFVGTDDDGAPKTCLLAGRKGSPDAPSFKALSWTLAHLNRGEIPADLKIQHETTCGRCGRALTVPESVASGFGPECINKIGA